MADKTKPKPKAAAVTLPIHIRSEVHALAKSSAATHSTKLYVFVEDLITYGLNQIALGKVTALTLTGRED